MTCRLQHLLVNTSIDFLSCFPPKCWAVWCLVNHCSLTQSCNPLFSIVFMATRPEWWHSKHLSLLWPWPYQREVFLHPDLVPVNNHDRVKELDSVSLTQARAKAKKSQHPGTVELLPCPLCGPIIQSMVWFVYIMLCQWESLRKIFSVSWLPLK